MKPMFRHTLIIFSLFITSLLYAQKNEIGVTGGVMYYLGDLNPIKHFKFSSPAVGLMYRHNWPHHFSIRGNIVAGHVYADDAKSGNGYQITRNLRFRSLIIEGSIQGEVNFFQFTPGDNKERFLTPFIFGGVGAFYFNPTTQASSGQTYLSPLNTEGQGSIPGRNPYLPVHACFPFGLGIKWNPWKGATLMLEWGMRATLTDYLDDVSTRYVDPNILTVNGKDAVILADQSINVTVDNTDRQRGFMKNKDWYSYLGFYLTFRIKDRKDDCWHFSRYKSFYVGKGKR